MDSIPVSIDVDPTSGAWRSEEQAMILIPRRFFVYLQMEAEKQFGTTAAQQLYDAATRRAARIWCENDARVCGLSGESVFARYLDRVSKRGMGRFRIEQLDVVSASASIALEHSIFVAEYGLQAGRRVCYSFSAALAGAMEYLRQCAGLPGEGITARETACASNGEARCVFEISSSPC